MKIRTKCLMLILLAMQLFIAAKSNAIIITPEGDRNSSLTLELTQDSYSLDLVSTFGINQFYIPFLSDVDVNLVVAESPDWQCFRVVNYFQCDNYDAFNNNTGQNFSTVDIFSANFSLPQGYVFNDLVETSYLTASRNDTEFELFRSYAPRIILATQLTPSVSAANSYSLLLIGVFCLFCRRKLKTQ